MVGGAAAQPAGGEEGGGGGELGGVARSQHHEVAAARKQWIPTFTLNCRAVNEPSQSFHSAQRRPQLCQFKDDNLWHRQL